MCIRDRYMGEQTLFFSHCSKRKASLKCERGSKKYLFKPQDQSQNFFCENQQIDVKFRDIRKPVSYTHLRAHETSLHLVCRLLLEKKKKNNLQIRQKININTIIYQY
eukprot:TRINITY_DN10364_c0_g1_i2.p1 TRINITY_DN10364_c0_g1~~TRINITY_DN10364_c0_g1_i2.p1  ORF type:complete len:107 (+),score=22.81 TRINITY_DN10364_c0_g1_i2:114-434(+)